MDLPRTIFLGLTLAALAFPVRRMLLWLSEYGLDTDLLIADLTASGATRSVTGAVLIASAALVVFIIGEATIRRDWLSMVCIPLTLIFGVAVGLPLYLYMRLRPLN
jgi:hypothetical protein